ncbi:MAG: outer membrane receptor protein involved in Fe transport [Arenicella sp.]|jgi:outer membrane receptor protein involved in Fe transport
MAQPPGGGHGKPGGGKGGRGGQPKGEIFGNVKDSLSNTDVAYATIIALRQPMDKMVGGVVTSDNGSFSIPDVPYGKYNLKISFVGYDTKIIENVVLNDENNTFQLKNLILVPTTLKTVEVIGDKPTITYEIDKKVINVEDQINTAGQTAIEILENIPSVTVAADGTVSLRGSSGFTLLIDGIPTAMDASDALATIPAASIKDIEIITNPSAKFDAEGTSGVINIITKKSKLEGMSGLINLTGGRFNNYNGDFSLNIKKSKWTFDLSGNIGNRSGPNALSETRTSTYDSLVNRIESVGEQNWQRSVYGGGGGIQFTPNNSHVIAIRTNLKWMKMLHYNNSDFESFDDDVLVDAFATESGMNIDMFNSSSNLYYRYNIKRNKDHYISVKAIANLKDVVQNDTTLSRDDEGNIVAGNLYTETGPSNSYRFNIDYKLPIKKNMKFETGVQAQFGQSGDIGKNYTYNTAINEFEFNQLFSSDVDYVRDVHAAYAIFAGKKNDFGYQLGLRAEYTFRTITSTSAVEFTEINRLDWFPSAHFSYSFDNKSQLLASYSRRIQRPRSWYFEPFITWESPYSVRSGNPNLQPEYINAFELNYMIPIKKTGFFSLEGYARINSGVVNRISTVYEEGILIEQPYNIGTSSAYGAEASLDMPIVKWWKINSGFNGYYFELDGELNDVAYTSESFNWGGRITNTFILGKKDAGKRDRWMLQLVSRYKSGSVTAQGRSLGAYTQDISLKKSFWKNRLAFTLQSRNLLATSRRVNYWTTANVDIETIRKPLAPQVQLTVSLKLNNYKKVFGRQETLDDF